MKKYKISLILNIIIFILVMLGTIFMIAGIRFMENDMVLTTTNIEAFKFFTVDSNVLMGICALIFAYFDYLVLSKKIKEIPNWLYKFKHIATVGVVLTFIVTVFYLAPFGGYSFFAFFKNSNLFFHLIVPILSIITYVLYEKNNKTGKSVVALGTITMIIYAVFYVINYIVNYSADKARETYDWYGLMSDSIIGDIISLSIMLILTCGISYCLWHLNKKSFK